MHERRRPWLRKGRVNPAEVQIENSFEIFSTKHAVLWLDPLDST